MESDVRHFSVARNFRTVPCRFESRKRSRICAMLVRCAVTLNGWSLSNELDDPNKPIWYLIRLEIVSISRSYNIVTDGEQWYPVEFYGTKLAPNDIKDLKLVRKDQRKILRLIGDYLVKLSESV